MNDLEKWVLKHKLIGDIEAEIDFDTNTLNGITILHRVDVLEIPPVKRVALKELSGCLEPITELIIPDTVKFIGVNSFVRLTNLEKVILGTGIKYISHEAFSGCTNLIEVKAKGKMPLVSGTAFRNTKFLDNIICDTDYILDGVLIRPKRGRTKIINDPNINEFAPGCFAYNKEINYVEIPEGVEFIPERCFEYCYGLSSIEIPSTVKEIKESAFNQCNSLNKVKLNEGLVVIGGYAFSSNKFTSLKLPSTVKEVKEGAFSYCVGLNALELNEGIEIIGKEAFMWCSIEKLITPRTLKKIRQKAFVCCYHLNELVLNEGLEIIGKEAFNCCSELCSVVIPSTVKEIGKIAFDYKCKIIRGGSIHNE